MNYQYYLKKCNFQELGSIGDDGVPKRGRYLFTSMDPSILSFFPPLSIAHKNDSALLAIIPLYSGEKVYCNFVYHNDKYHNSTAKNPRNEYRIYLNNKIECGKLLFETDDILVFRSDDIIDSDRNKQTVYYLDMIKDQFSPYYKKCYEIIENTPINGGYGLYDGIIPEFEKKLEYVNTKGEVPVVIDQAVTKVIERVTVSSGLESLFNSASFRDFVMFGYKNLCAITETVIKYGNYINLEAAHIVPKSHGGFWVPSNGIALTRDLHWAFDKGFFTLDDDYKIKIHPKISSDYLYSLNGKQIRLPEDTFFIPHIDNLHYHQENIYGLFLTTGRL